MTPLETELLAALCAIVNGEVIISNKGGKLYTFPDQSACLSEHDPKVIQARKVIAQARQIEKDLEPGARNRRELFKTD